MDIRIEHLDNIAQAARTFLKEVGNERVFAFYGKMGAGKTTFIKAVCEVLGVSDAVASPTFAIVNEYQAGTAEDMAAAALQNALDGTALTEAANAPEEGGTLPDASILRFAGQPIFHFDFYRIRHLGEAQDIGIDDYFYSGNLCFIEWPELIEPLLPEDATCLTIEELPDGTRRISDGQRPVDF